MYPAINWQAIATISAVVLTATLGAFAYLYRGREERRRILSVSLFHLLEIWQQLRLISRWKPAELVDVMFAEIKAQMPSIEIPESEKKDAARMIHIIWHPLLSDVMGRREQSTEKSFLETIENLSKVDPLIAVRLNGNRTLKAAIIGVNAYAKSYETHLAATNAPDLPQFQAMMQDAQEFIPDDALRDLEKDLRSLSLRIGLTMWARTAWYLRSKKVSPEDFRKAMRPYIAKIIVPHLQTQPVLTKTATAGSIQP